MPTSTFSHTRGVYSGQFSVSNGSTDQVVGGRMARLFVGRHCRVDFAFKGGGCTMPWYAGSGSLKVSIDGGAYATITPAPGAWTDVAIATGLADAWHDARVQAIYDVYMAIDGATFSVTGAAPECVPLPASEGMQLLVAQTFVDPLNRTQLLNFARIEAGYAASNNFFTNYAEIHPTFPVVAPNWLYGANLVTGGQYRFNATIGELAIWTYHDGRAAFALVVDGVSQGTVYTANLGYEDWLTLSSELDETTEHTYGIQLCALDENAMGVGSGSIYAIRIRGGTGVIGPRPAVRPLALILGDEWAFYQANFRNFSSGNPEDYDFTRMWAFKTFEPFGWQIANGGIHSTTVKDFTGNEGTLPAGLGGRWFVTDWSLQRRIAYTLGLFIDPAPDLIIIFCGTYDALNFYSAGGLPTETIAEFQASVTATLTAAVAARPGVPIHWVGIPPRYDRTRAQLAAWRAAQSAGVAAVGSPAVRYHDPLSIGLDESDGTPVDALYIDAPTGTTLNDVGSTVVANFLRSKIHQAPAILGTPAAGFRQALNVQLVLDAGLDAFVSGKIYPQRIPQRGDTPAVVWTVSAIERDHDLDGPTGLATATVRMEVVDVDALVADRIAARLRGMFDGFRGILGGLVEVLETTHEDEGDDYSEPADASDDGLCRVALDYAMMFREVPANRTG